MTEPQANVEALELINGELKERLARQRDAANRVDVKATDLLTLLLASVPLDVWALWSWYVLPARLFILGSAVAAVRCLRVRAIWDAPIAESTCARARRSREVGHTPGGPPATASAPDGHAHYPSVWES